MSSENFYRDNANANTNTIVNAIAIVNATPTTNPNSHNNGSVNMNGNHSHVIHNGANGSVNSSDIAIVVCLANDVLNRGQWYPLHIKFLNPMRKPIFMGRTVTIDPSVAFHDSRKRPLISGPGITLTDPNGPILLNVSGRCSLTGRELQKCQKCQEQDKATTNRKRKRDSEDAWSEVDQENNAKLFQILENGGHKVGKDGLLELRFRALCCVGAVRQFHKNHVNYANAEDIHKGCEGFELRVTARSGNSEAVQVLQKPVRVVGKVTKTNQKPAEEMKEFQPVPSPIKPHVFPSNFKPPTQISPPVDTGLPPQSDSLLKSAEEELDANRRNAIQPFGRFSLPNHNQYYKNNQRSWKEKNENTKSDKNVSPPNDTEPSKSSKRIRFDDNPLLFKPAGEGTFNQLGDIAQKSEYSPRNTENCQLNKERACPNLQYPVRNILGSNSSSFSFSSPFLTNRGVGSTHIPLPSLTTTTNESPRNLPVLPKISEITADLPEPSRMILPSPAFTPNPFAPDPIRKWGRSDSAFNVVKKPTSVDTNMEKLFAVSEDKCKGDQLEIRQILSLYNDSSLSPEQVIQQYRELFDDYFHLSFRTIFEPNFFKTENLSKIPFESIEMLHVLNTLSLVHIRFNHPNKEKLWEVGESLARRLLEKRSMIKETGELVRLADAISRSAVIQLILNHFKKARFFSEESYRLFEALGHLCSEIRNKRCYEFMLWHYVTLFPQSSVLHRALEWCNNLHCPNFECRVLILYVLSFFMENMDNEAECARKLRRPLPPVKNEQKDLILECLAKWEKVCFASTPFDSSDHLYLMIKTAISATQKWIVWDLDGATSSVADCAFYSTKAIQSANLTVIDSSIFDLTAFIAIQLVGLHIFPVGKEEPGKIDKDGLQRSIDLANVLVKFGRNSIWPWGNILHHIYIDTLDNFLGVLTT
eukprot:TRINITY_DN20211_c0_g1_i1.p1 TRINITY_DN20211_c0_g1~~TRINITY_DN20211_c0_g1_i1.p1  ORF type:complete len:928 (+),score=90.83 TRINITY_DN20211_c0_g1_i1:52-2835(+)